MIINFWDVYRAKYSYALEEYEVFPVGDCKLGTLYNDKMNYVEIGI